MSDNGPSAQPCRFTLATPKGRGAVASILLAGADAAQIAAPFFQSMRQGPLAAAPLGVILFGRWRLDAGLEDVVVCRPDEQSLEIHCHGGPVVAQGVMATLAASGCCEWAWSDWVQHQQSVIQAEAAIALAAAQTEQTALVLLDQFHGALQMEVEAILQELSAANIESARARLGQLLNAAQSGRHLTQPWNIVLAGRPNVGKSSLINALLGFQRALVHNRPGTTRDVVTAGSAVSGWPVEFSDTAGLRTTSDDLEAEGIALAQAKIDHADLVLWVRACGEGAQPEDEYLEESRAFGAVAADALLCVRNKCDLEPRIQDDGEIRTCALSGEGIGELLEAISLRLGPLPAPEEPTPFTARQEYHLQQAADALENNDPANACECLQSLLSGPVSAEKP